MLAQKIRKKIVQAISDYQLIDEGDRVLVAVSGGIDSTVLLLRLEEIRRKSPVKFTLRPVYVDQGFPDVNTDPFKRWLSEKGFTLTTLSVNSHSIIHNSPDQKSSPCRICSRLRRGVLYTYASENELSKIALGHNRDDLNETLLMNMLFAGKIAGMPPKFRSDDRRNILIRPMCYLPKSTIREYARQENLPIVRNPFCESRQETSRSLVRKLLRELEEINPKTSGSLLTSQKNVRVSRLLDRSLWDFNP